MSPSHHLSQEPTGMSSQMHWQGMNLECTTALVSAKGADLPGNLQRLGAAIRAAREDKALSQEELAHAAGIDRSHMGKIERGERNVTLLSLIRAAGALGTTASDLLINSGL